MAKELIGYYKADTPEDYTAMVFADLIRKGIFSSVEGLDPEIAAKVKEYLKEAEESE